MGLEGREEGKGGAFCQRKVAFLPNPPTHTPRNSPSPFTPQSQFPPQISIIISSNVLTFLVQKSKNHKIVLNYRLYLRKIDFLAIFCVLIAPIYRNIFQRFILFIIFDTYDGSVKSEKSVKSVQMVGWRRWLNGNGWVVGWGRRGSKVSKVSQKI